MQEVELLQATVDAIGEADNEIGGFRQTRVVTYTETGAATPASFLSLFNQLFSIGRDPVELSVGDWIRGAGSTRLFQITAINPSPGFWEVVVDQVNGPFPATGGGTFTGTVTWDGTTTVWTDQPEVIAIGDWISSPNPAILSWFEVIGKNGNYLTIANPNGFVIPIVVDVGTALYSSDPNVYLVVDELEVESVLNWPDSGFVAVGGILYAYAGKSLSPMKLTGLTHFDASTEIVGLYQTHRVGDVVTDVTRDFSGLELARNAILVDYADGEDLNALGRNYGVLRYPFLASDDVFRKIVKALAYNPRGTMFGLELALDALIGEGNYELYEDLVNHPCTVFVRLLGDAALEDRSTGKAILTGPEAVDPTSTTSVAITGTVITRGTVYSVRLKDHVHDGDFRTVKPSALQIEDVAGSPVQAWTYDGTGGSTEGTNVTQLAGLGVQFTHTGVSVSKYTAARRFIDRNTDWSVDCTLRIPASATLSNFTTRYRQLCVTVQDGEDDVGFGFRDSGAFVVGISLLSGFGAVGTGSAITKDAYVPLQLRKTGGYDGLVELLSYGKVIASAPRSAFTSSTSARSIEFGIDHNLAPSTVQGIFTQLSFSVRPRSKDYWNLYHAAATLGVPDTIQIATSEFLAGDVDKRIEILGSGITNAYGGNNNGKFEVSVFTDVNNIEVQGVEQEDAAATVGSTEPLRIIVDSRKQQFVFPDDLGKEIVLLDSAQGNNGSYVIEKLLDPDDPTIDLEADYATRLRTVTNICEIVLPAPGFEFVAETAINFRLDPVFVAEGSMSFVLSDAGSESGGTLTLREALPSASDIVEVWYNEVLSALVLLDFSIKNEIVQLLPDILWQYYPFYLSDPLGFVRAYLDDITAAGVIPEYFVE